MSFANHVFTDNSIYFTVCNNTILIYTHHFALGAKECMAFTCVIVVSGDKGKNVVIMGICRAVGYPEMQKRIIRSIKIVGEVG